ncbi:hypothetical protein [Helicobacter macacae]|uniref:Uncharacterized protein n=1 Tax=Helicobacter macacae MIT 99-5501 TaxID=1357400 RepID=V8C7A9_9HELI|nr:hypothetical protein [Helicobacter macacae]ETD23298.1 hypothetical protein HMPREF2086_01097 [Helicobacter macacae MIT 99-5501]
MNTTTKTLNTKSAKTLGAKTLKSQNTTTSATKSVKISEAKKDKGFNLSLKTLQVAELFTSIESKREFAKLGMSVSLLTCVGSAFFKGNFARNLHIASGVALVGFSIWHHSLYDKNK